MASLYGLPLVMFNLGAEMIYVLEQRLRAQCIPPEKSQKVLQDVSSSLFDAAFVDALLRPQALYTLQATRLIFERLAHSSIMRLSESSMDKLFDLMTMGFKYQLACCTRPGEVLEVTLNHTTHVRSMLSDAQLMAAISTVNARLTNLYAGFTAGDWRATRQSLFNFLQDKRVKVSLFLQEGLQSTDGRIRLPAPTRSAEDPDQVGTIRMFASADGTPKGSSAVALAGIEAESAGERGHPVPLGGNLYAKDRPPTTTEPAAPGGDPSTAPGTTGGSSPKAAADEPPARKKPTAEELMAQPNAKVTQELNSLSSLIRPPKAPEKESFRLNLFGDQNPTSPPTSSASDPLLAIKAKRGAAAEKSLHIGSAANAQLDSVMKNLDLGAPAPAAAADDADDLLDLMDGLED
mmetsp:Transcript_14389/g.47266  ORF Transcript_14389/g.47266 Transcript_14389/m.47266 type:complete len:405 (-) Transcript_14389:471-1685(-)